MWQFYVNSMQRHIRMHKKPTYPNIGDVEKMGSTTWKQTLNQTLMDECNAVQTQSCGSLEISTSRKEKRTPQSSLYLNRLEN
jgi:hypothetical protein